ncbi:MMPL family transporter [bacterium]|nr:MMPL family transporter [bacterium]
MKKGTARLITSLIDYWAKGVIRHRVVVLALSLLLLAALIYPVSKLTFDNSIEMWFLEGDQTLTNLDWSRELFGDDQYFLIGIEARSQDKTVMNPDTLLMIHEITDFLEEQESVTKVTSLANYQYLLAENDMLESRDLIEDVEALRDNRVDLAALETIMKNETHIHGKLITGDLRHTMISARVLYKPQQFDHHLELSRGIYRFIEEQQYLNKGFNLHYYGFSPNNERIYTATQKDQKTIQPIMVLVILVLLFFSFRTIAGVLSPLVVIVGSVIVMFASIQLLGWHLTILNAYLPVVIIAVGIGDAVHILTEFFSQRHKGLSPEAASEETIRTLFVPCFYTSLTTVLGFLAITITRLATLREFGTGAAVGVSMAFILSFTTLPAILSYTQKTGRKPKHADQPDWSDRLINWIPRFTRRHNKTIIAVSGTLFLVSIALSLQIKTDTNFKYFFKRGSKAQEDIAYFDKVYSYSGGMAIIIDSGSEDGIKDPHLLKQVVDLQEYLETLPLAGRSVAVTNYVRQMNKIMHNNDEQFYTIPDNRESVAQLLLMYSLSGPADDLSDLKSFDDRYLKIDFPQVHVSAFETMEQLKKVQNKLATDFPDLEVTLTGGAIVDSVRDSYTINGFIQSFSLAFFIVSLCFLLLLRSIRYGILAIIPCFIPIIIAGGIMSLLDIYLDFNTMVIAAMTFGIAVDDTIHIMNRYLQARKAGSPPHDAIKTTLNESGKAIVFTSIILFFGFGLHVLASFAPAVNFGILGGAIILMACIADLIMLPALLQLREKG